jgi:hypothetical protein
MTWQLTPTQGRAFAPSAAGPSAAAVLRNCKRPRTKVERYTKAADQRMPSEAAIAKLAREQTARQIVARV